MAIQNRWYKFHFLQTKLAMERILGELRRTQINVVMSNSILKAPSASTLLTNHGWSPSRCWCNWLGGEWVGVKGESGEPGEKPSKHKTNQLQQLYSQEFQLVIAYGYNLDRVENQDARGYTQMLSHPTITRPARLNMESSRERQHAHRISYLWFPYYWCDISGLMSS